MSRLLMRQRLRMVGGAFAYFFDTVSGTLLPFDRSTDQRMQPNHATGIGFVNRAGGDVRLSPSSLGYRVFAGKDAGADVALVNGLLEDVI